MVERGRTEVDQPDLRVTNEPERVRIGHSCQKLQSNRADKGGQHNQELCWTVSYDRRTWLATTIGSLYLCVVPEAIYALTVRLRALEGCCVTHVSASKAKAMKLLGGTEGKNESTARGH